MIPFRRYRGFIVYKRFPGGHFSVASFRVLFPSPCESHRCRALFAHLVGNTILIANPPDLNSIALISRGRTHRRDRLLLSFFASPANRTVSEELCSPVHSELVDGANLPL